jgi:hypothetical protein
MTNCIYRYLERDDRYKFTLFRIDRVNLNYQISSNLKPELARQNFILGNVMIANVNVNIKPDIIEELIDIGSYFKHFALWKELEPFKPNIRPVLNEKLVNSKPATRKMRSLVIQ